MLPAVTVRSERIYVVACAYCGKEQRYPTWEEAVRSSRIHRRSCLPETTALEHSPIPVKKTRRRKVPSMPTPPTYPGTWWLGR